MPIEEVIARQVIVAIGLALALLVRSPPLLADSPARSESPAQSSPSGARSPAPLGLAVVAFAGATDAAWPLARSVYATASLRPPSLDEAHAHVLCGEAAPAGAPADVRDLAETVAALRGDDAPSRALLGDIARRLSVQAVVVVRASGERAERATARVFLPEAGIFDAATYAPDDASTLTWSAATRSLARAFGRGSSAAEFPPVQAGGSQAPRLATHGEPKVSAPATHRHEFYESGWFWGALGAAALAGGTVFLATRDSSAPAIHLQLEVPR